jgi:hypothetical protein
VELELELHFQHGGGCCPALDDPWGLPSYNMGWVDWGGIVESHGVGELGKGGEWRNFY